MSEREPDDIDRADWDQRQCRHCRGLGYWPATHDRGAVPCGCTDPREDDEEDEQ